jgi:uncharacterized repeat protein (TIGR02543 family)
MMTSSTITIAGSSGDATTNTTRKVNYNATVGALPTPTRTGYTLKGWYTAASGGTKISSTTKITKAVTFYAQWTAVSNPSTNYTTGQTSLQDNDFKETISLSTAKSKDNQRAIPTDLSTDLRTKFLQIAVSQEGYSSGKVVDIELDAKKNITSANIKFPNKGLGEGYLDGWTKYGPGSGLYRNYQESPWCAVFVSWCAKQADVPTDVIQRSTYANMNKFFSGTENLQWKKRGKYIPVAGDLIYYNWSANMDGTFDHVGIVIGCDGTYVYTIEGNTLGSDSNKNTITGQVYRKKRALTYQSIKGYCPVQF